MGRVHRDCVTAAGHSVCLQAGPLCVCARSSRTAVCVCARVQAGPRVSPRCRPQAAGRPAASDCIICMFRVWCRHVLITNFTKLAYTTCASTAWASPLPLPAPKIRRLHCLLVCPSLLSKRLSIPSHVMTWTHFCRISQHSESTKIWITSPISVLLCDVRYDTQKCKKNLLEILTPFHQQFFNTDLIFLLLCSTRRYTRETGGSSTEIHAHIFPK